MSTAYLPNSASSQFPQSAAADEGHNIAVGIVDALVGDLSRQLNLHFHAARRHRRSEVERLHGVIKGEFVRDERLHINLSSAHQGKGAREDMRVAENVFDPHFLCLRGNNIERTGSSGIPMNTTQPPGERGSSKPCIAR